MNEPEEYYCYDCSNDFPWVRSFDSPRKPDQCPDCKIKYERQQSEEKRIKAVDSIKDETPPRYRSTDINHVDFNRKLWSDIKAWRPTAETPWLGMIGPSGASKTRCAYLLLHAIVMEDFDQSAELSDWYRAMSFERAESYTIAKCVSDQYDNDYQVKNPAKEFLRDIRRTGILILDDFGKAKNTPAFAAELFAIIDHRHAHNLPMIWTANSSPEDLVAGMSEDMAGPLAGRLIECSRIVIIK